MLKRVMIDGINLPRLYIAENKKDAELAMSKGIPFVRWSQGQDALIKMLLRPVLEKLFPHVKWNKVLGTRRKFRTQVEMVEAVNEIGDLDVSMPSDTELSELSEPTTNETVSIDESIMDKDEDGTVVETADIASSERLFTGGGGEMTPVHMLDLEDYIGDLSSNVNLEVLQRLRLMPAFIGDILDCIKINVGSGMRWREGYNKRLGIPVGRFDAGGQLPNLIILDVSGSIPRGISATMIALIDTLRTQLSADLIITSSNSRFYPMGSELPDPQRIRDMFGYGNEAVEFWDILSTNIRGRHYGHVFSFGDNDTPDEFIARYRREKNKPLLEGTIVEHVHHYHTGYYWGRDRSNKTGYAKWCHGLAKEPITDYDTSWCEVIKD